MVLATVWFLWGQEEKFWYFKLLNIIPGPTRGNPYIVDEFARKDACMEAYFKENKMQLDISRLPEIQEEIKKFGGPHSATSYACVPAPFKPERIAANHATKSTDDGEI